MIQTTSVLGSLNCRIIQSGQEGAPPDLVVILCHGFGAAGDDLVPLGRDLLSRLPSSSRVRLIFPAALLSLDAVGMFGGRAWWEIDMARLMSLQEVGRAGLEQMRVDVPEGLPRARRALLGLVEEVSRQTGLGPSRMVLGGFSQGAMLATDVALRLEEPPAALCILSGTLICEADWTRRAPMRAGLRVLQSHGAHDPLLPYENALALRDLLTRSGLRVDFVTFGGEHAIPAEALERMAALLSDLVTSRGS